jgi:hypothetical protein
MILLKKASPLILPEQCQCAEFYHQEKGSNASGDECHATFLRRSY